MGKLTRFKADKKNQSIDNVSDEAVAFGFMVVPDKDDPDSSDVFVDGTVDEKPYRFRLDTGAGRTSIGSDEFTLGFKVVGKTTGAGAFAKVHDDLIEVSQVCVGNLSQSPATVIRTPKNAQDRANLLGMDFMKGHALHFRYESNSVQLIDSKKPLSEPLLDLFVGESGHPYVDLTWHGGVRARGVWDTGAGITLFDLGFVKKHPELFTNAGTSIGTDSSGTTQETPVYLMKGFTSASGVCTFLG
jgi:hypothetical protein